MVGMAETEYRCDTSGVSSTSTLRKLTFVF
jgi:hypothetical protein